MSTDPSRIQLSPEQQGFVAELADKTGKPWATVLGEALGEYATEQVSHQDHPKPRAVFGSGRDLISLSDDFDAPLVDFRDYLE